MTNIRRWGGRCETDTRNRPERRGEKGEMMNHEDTNKSTTEKNRKRKQERVGKHAHRVKRRKKRMVGD